MMGTPKKPLYETVIDLEPGLLTEVCAEGRWIEVEGDDAEWVTVRTKDGGRPSLALAWTALDYTGIKWVRTIVLAKSITAHRMEVKK